MLYPKYEPVAILCFIENNANPNNSDLENNHGIVEVSARVNICPYSVGFHSAYIITLKQIYYISLFLLLVKRRGRPSLVETHPALIEEIKTFIEQNTAAAHLRRRN